MYNQQENILSIIDALQTIDFVVFHACLVKTLSKRISNSLKIDSSIELQKNIDPLIQTTCGNSEKAGLCKQIHLLAEKKRTVSNRMTNYHR